MQTYVEHILKTNSMKSKNNKTNIKYMGRKHSRFGLIALRFFLSLYLFLSVYMSLFVSLFSILLNCLFQKLINTIRWPSTYVMQLLPFGQFAIGIFGNQWKLVAIILFSCGSQWIHMVRADCLRSKQSVKIARACVCVWGAMELWSYGVEWSKTWSQMFPCAK